MRWITENRQQRVPRTECSRGLSPKFGFFRLARATRSQLGQVADPQAPRDSAIECPLTRSCLGTGPRPHPRATLLRVPARLGALAAICRSQLSKMLRSNSTNQLKSRAVLASKFFNLQGHGCLRKCKVRAVRKCWNNSQLLKNMLPYFRQLPTSRREICDSAPPLQHAVRNSSSQLLSAGQFAKREI